MPPGLQKQQWGCIQHHGSVWRVAVEALSRTSPLVNCALCVTVSIVIDNGYQG
jgi:hypothetical protein